jgi:hypothetical protein
MFGLAHHMLGVLFHLVRSSTACPRRDEGQEPKNLRLHGDLNHREARKAASAGPYARSFHHRLRTPC